MNERDDNSVRRHTFGLIGAAGYVAPKHLKAIQDTGSQLVAAIDPRDSVGILDSYFPEARFFTEIERFDRYLEHLRRQDLSPVDFISICSPNYLHDAHVRLALRIKANAICEKPLVINPWNLEQLADLEKEHGHHVYTLLQLRVHPAVLELKRSLESKGDTGRPQICLTYIAPRGPWYNVSWKGSEEKSGGLAMNIGIHFFDLLLWLFGPVEKSQVHLSTQNKMAGNLELATASVQWFLSIDKNDLPREVVSQENRAYRCLAIDGEALELSHDNLDLHTAAYREVIAGRGVGIADVRPSIELVYDIRQSCEVSAGPEAHPYLRKKKGAGCPS